LSTDHVVCDSSLLEGGVVVSTDKQIKVVFSEGVVSSVAIRRGQVSLRQKSKQKVLAKGLS